MLERNDELETKKEGKEGIVELTSGGKVSS